MGTQFASRLHQQDAQRVISGIKAARSRVSRGKGPSKAQGTVLKPAERRQLARAVMAEVMRVAESRSFSQLFQQSQLFDLVLDWLKELRTDAVYNGFQGSIQKYELAESPSAVSKLHQTLKELIQSMPEWETDPFRVAISTSAGGVLSQVMSQRVEKLPGESEAEQFGRKLEAVELLDIVKRFIEGFLDTFLTAVLRRSDPRHDVVPVEEETALSRDAAEDISRRIVRAITRSSSVADTQRIHAIVLEELRKLVGEPVAAESRD